MPSSYIERKCFLNITWREKYAFAKATESDFSRQEPLEHDEFISEGKEDRVPGY